jgi:tetratricopeptide (TPR) repeat protein
MQALPSAQAQSEDVVVPELDEAEALFEQALDAFERGEYALAQRRFRLVTEYRLNQKTTASLLMAGKALYRLGQHARAVDVLTTLLDRYPETSYRAEAEEVLDYARSARSRTQGEPDRIRVGIVLPLAGEDAPLAQAMFNGIRLAVDEHNGIERRYVSAEEEQAGVVRTANESSRRVIAEQGDLPDRVAEMYFRNSQGRVDGARAAADSLVRIDNVDFIIGPLYSPQAQAAGEVAERAGVVMIAPLATDGAVSAGRRYVFQANPTIETRGEIMARFAVRSLLVDGVGIIAEEGNDFSERMAEGFRREIERLDAQLAFDERLPNARAWSQLQQELQPDSLSRDSLRRAEALYLPIAGRDAGGRIQDALAGLDWLSRTSGITFRVLGNAEWHGLAIDKLASPFQATYTNDFYIDETRPAVQAYMRRYRLLTGKTLADLNVTARRLAFTGYDVARFMLEQRSVVMDQPLEQIVREAPAYEGVGIKLNFDGRNVNQAMFIHRYRNNQVDRLR